MSSGQGQFDELGLLAAALCDGELTPQQAERLETLVNRSEAARRYFLNYTGLHAELYWETAFSADASLLHDPAAQPAVRPRLAWLAVPRRAVVGLLRRRRLWAGLAVAALLLAGVTLLVLRPHKTQLASSARPAAVAEVVGVVDAVWADGLTAAAGSPLPAGRHLDLQRGAAEVRFASGASVILQGPARFEPTDFNRGLLHEGTLTATVPHAAAGFAVATPAGEVVDRGTEFALSVGPSGRSQVQVFQGSVDVVPARAAGQTVRAGQAVCVIPPSPGEPAHLEQLAFGGRSFPRSLADIRAAGAAAGSVAQLRAVVSRDPHLIHHYPFEGATAGERCRDRRGDLHLSEVVMAGGRGGGAVEYGLPGFDGTTTAVAPFRAPGRYGNTRGVSLQSQNSFQPPAAMTVELLLNFARPGGDDANPIAVAVGTRENERRCGFFAVTVDQGQLVHLLDGAAPWTETNLELIPGDWYYVASTFDVQGDRTRVNTYVANLSRRETTLGHVLRDQWAAGGSPAASRLGIGKGFNDAVAHAYPWSGALDEVAIYDAVLDEATLDRHLEAVVGARHPPENSNTQSPSPPGRGPR